MPFVPTIHAFLRRTIEFFGCVYVLSFLTFIGLLVYTGHAGTLGPDATHTVSMVDHGRTYYLTIWQSGSRWWAGVTMGVSGTMTFLSAALVAVIERRQRS